MRSCCIYLDVKISGRLRARENSLNPRRCKMFRRLYATDDSTATSILRLVLGVVFFAHGAQKLLGWFGGFGFEGSMGFFTGMKKPIEPANPKPPNQPNSF